jgi:hypothetical protein
MVAAGTRADTPGAFGDAHAWQVSASDDVTATLRTAAGERGNALCLDYDLHGTAGYASLRRTLPLDFPSNYMFDLRVRGSGPANTLQFKLLDASGDNVWWRTWPDFTPPAQWAGLRIPKSAIDFAWGPRKDHALTHSAALELTVAAGKGGGRGKVCFEALRLSILPVATPTPAAPPTLPANPNAYFETRAKRAPRGFYPRGFSGGQSYWTLVGIDGGADSGLLSEDGALEIGKGGFSVEPFLIDAGKLVTWADVTAGHSLRDGYLPIPSVVWQHDGLQLRVTSFGAGDRASEQLVARYEIANTSGHARDATLVLAVRPFQVDPPTQFLNAAGGVSRIHRLAWQGRTLRVDGRVRIELLRAPDAQGVTPFAQGSIVADLARSQMPSAQVVHDPQGFASAAASYRLHLAPHAHAVIGLIASLRGQSGALELGALDAAAWLQREEDAIAASWRTKLDRVALRLPSAQRRITDTLRSSLAWILMSRDGPELRPGTRSYARSWIRDGAMMSDALLRLGHADVARDYALWYAPYQFTTGKVPCCVDTRGADPTPENDSPGELLHLIAQVYRYTGDRDFLQQLWPHVTATVAYAQRKIDTQSGAACTAPATRMFCGLLPASISHEGYSAHPEHSYWDDFWMLTGYDDAIAIAQALGKTGEADTWTRQRDGFRHNLYASIRTSIAAHRIGYIPGSAELGDFDPTSTTIALEPGGQSCNLAHELPAGLLHDTFERYWHESLARADGTTPWNDYTPYEWRNVGVFARLGWRTRIPALLDFLFDGQRPAGWNGWAEVVGHDARKPRFIGDLPHAWVASDYIRATLDLFVYPRYRDGALVLAAGVQPDWLDNGGIALAGLRTPWGELGYTLQWRGDSLVWHIQAGVHPPGGMILTWPLAGQPGAIRVNGRPATAANGHVVIHALPADVVMQPSGAPH